MTLMVAPSGGAPIEVDDAELVLHMVRGYRQYHPPEGDMDMVWLQPPNPHDPPVQVHSNPEILTPYMAKGYTETQPPTPAKGN